MFFWTKVFVNSSSTLSEVVVTILCALFFNRSKALLRHFTPKRHHEDESSSNVQTLHFNIAMRREKADMSPASNTLSQMLAPGIISTWFEPALRTQGLLYVNVHQ